MEPEKLKEYVISFSEWEKEYRICELKEFKRITQKLGGMPSIIEPSCSELYDKWINRTEMTFQEAMNIVLEGGFVTHPRYWSAHRGYIDLKNGIVHLFIEGCQEGMLYTSNRAYTRDKTARDWYKFTPINT